MSATASSPEPQDDWPNPAQPSPAVEPTPATQPSPAAPSPATGQPPGSAPGAGPSLEVRRTRTGTLYVASIVSLLLAVVVIIFIVQNQHGATVHFLPWSFHLPLGVVILAAAVAGGLVVVLISLARVLQLRLAARRHRRSHRNPRPSGG